MKRFCLGFDLCEAYSQLSYYDEEKNSPESVSQSVNQETYLLPNIVFYGEDTDRFYIGYEAQARRFEQQGQVIEHIVANVESISGHVLGGQPYSNKDLFFILMDGYINEFLGRYPEAEIAKLVVAVYEYRKGLFRVLKEWAAHFGLSEEQFEICSHSNSYLHYVFHQSEDIRRNSVALFDYSSAGLDYYRIDVSKKNQVRMIQIVHKDYSGSMPYSMAEEGGDILDMKFAKIAKGEMDKTYISAVYLTGIGFADEWMKESLRSMYGGRRVFMGQNIYTKGACYAAYSGSATIEQDYMIRSDEMIPFDIGIYLDEDKRQFVPIALGCTEWYNMKGSIEIFLDDTRRLEMVYRDRVKNQLAREVIEINGLPKRPPKTTKLSLSVECYNERQGAIVIRDLGFGKLYPTTNKVYRKEFLVEQEEIN